MITREVNVKDKQGEDISFEVVMLERDDVGSAAFRTNWKRDLRERLDWIYGTIRPRVCLVCGGLMSTYHLHHGILSRRNVQGWKKPLRMLIEVEWNLIPLHDMCHLQHPPSREDCWIYQQDFYGRELLEEWLYSLPWKTGKPPRHY